MFDNKYLIDNRVKGLFLIIGLLFVLLVVRLYFIMVKDSEELATIAKSQITIKENRGDLNYNLLDCNGKNLLEYKEKYYICVYSNIFIKNSYNTKLDDIVAMNIILKQYNEEYDLVNIDTDSYEKVIWEVDEKTYNLLSEIEGVKGVYVYSERDVDRTDNPHSVENIISNMYHFVPVKNENGEVIYVERRKDDKYDKAEDDGEEIDEENNKEIQEGSDEKNDKLCLECEIEEFLLDNKYVQDIYNIDQAGAIEYISTEVPKENYDTVLTIDKEIQLKIDEVINSEKYEDNGQIGVVLMESDTGKIRGLTQKDATEPNIIIGEKDYIYCPGSIFKIIVEEAALEEQITIEGESILNHIFTYKQGHTSDHFETYPMNISEALIMSSNNIFSQIGCLIGLEKINEYAVQQGLGEEVLKLCDEGIGGQEGDEEAVGYTGLTAIGKTLKITPLQAISIPNTIINNGIYVKPNIIEGFVNGAGEIVELEDIVEKRIVSEANADIIKNQMISVVREGTGKKAYSSYINLGGKTGTAELNSKNNLWFAGFFEIDEKSYSMVVFVPGREDGVMAGNVCAPIFKDIVENLYTYLQ